MAKLIPIPDPNIYNDIDKAGLTRPEKAALRKSWNVLRKNVEEHIRNISIIFFEKYPDYLKNFEVDPPDNVHLHHYTKDLMNDFGILIEKGFYDAGLYEKTISESAKKHRELNLMKEDFELVAGIVGNYIAETLDRQITETLLVALNTFLNGFSKFFDSNEDDEEEVDSKLM